MSEKPGESPAQKSVTTIDPWVPRIAAVGVPAIAATAIFVGGTDFAPALLLWGAVILLFVGITALVAYMLTSGQFPPRLSRAGVELPPDEVEDTGKSLDFVSQTLIELVDRVERIETHLELGDD